MSYNSTKETTKLFLDTLIDEFGSFRECPTSIKHAKTGQYILCNGNLANRDGIPIEEYVGLTAQDVQKIMGWKESVTTNAVSIDQQISERKIPEARYNQVLLMRDKSVIIEEVCKKPVLGSNKQIAAILGYAHDITQHAHPLYLFSLYASYHPTPEAIRYFLRYKGLDTAFEVLPTREELLTLLTMRDTADIGMVAQSLHYSVAEVQKHQAQLAAKIKVLELNDVLSRLQWHSEDAGQNIVG